ncbi:MAG: universal stress protein, partial [Microbacteriaceae bacterium]
ISKHAAADLIVVGTHKTGFSRGRLFGSRSLQVAAETVHSVAIIPESARRSRSGIVVGVAETPGGAGALEFAATEAERTNQELTLIRAWTLPEHPPETVSRTWEKIYETEAKRILADAVTLVHRRHRRLITRSRSIRRRASDALLDASVSARLLVIGAADRDRRGGTLGGVGHDVLLNLVGPTVLVHPDHGEDGCQWT